MINDVTPPGWQRPKTKTIQPPEKPAAPALHEQAQTIDPEFKTPEEMALETPVPPAPLVTDHAEPMKHRNKLALKLPWPPTRKQSIVYGAVAVVVAFGLGAGWTLTHHKRAVVAEAKQSTTKKVAAKPVIYSTLSGLPVADESVNKRPVTGVMIENSVDARPQSGLSDAGVVFEAVAEGGVTRFLALFQDTAPENIGPIRSARPYYVSWAMGFDAAYAHVGGSPDALADISAWGTKDMNQFSNGNYYHRTSDRDAPHNVYTSISKLNELESAKGYTSTFTGFSRKADKPYVAPTTASATSKTTTKPATADTRTVANSLDFSLSGYTYDPHFDYIPATNSYNRSEAGEPHMDTNGNKQISPKVVIAMVVPLGRGALDSSGAYYSNYNVVGSGQAYVFQDGTVTTATWNKASNNGGLSFTDTNGAPLTLNRGQTWISAVSEQSKVSYK